MLNWFKKQTCYCKDHDDLRELQELNLQLKELQSLKEQTNKLFPNHEDYESNSYNDYFHNSFWRGQAEQLGYCFTCAFYGKMNLTQFVKNIQPHLPYKDAEYLKDIGEFCIAAAERLEECNSIDKEIDKIKIKIKELKNKLEI